MGTGPEPRESVSAPGSRGMAQRHAEIIGTGLSLRIPLFSLDYGLRTLLITMRYVGSRVDPTEPHPTAGFRAISTPRVTQPRTNGLTHYSKILPGLSTF